MKSSTLIENAEKSSSNNNSKSDKKSGQKGSLNTSSTKDSSDLGQDNLSQLLASDNQLNLANFMGDSLNRHKWRADSVEGNYF